MEVQLEFNFDNKAPDEIRLSVMQTQLNQMNDSMGKVRRKLFADLGEMKKVCSALQQENHELKAMLRELKFGKDQWSYKQNGKLFELRDYHESVG